METRQGEARAQARAQAQSGAGKPVYIFTRFSVYNYPSGIIRKHAKEIKNAEDYQRIIYGSPRLDAKFAAFERFTVPSVLAQERRADRWLIFTSPQLPAEYQARLRGALKGVSEAEIVMVHDYEEMLEAGDSLVKAAGTAAALPITVNLDDDDALHPKYLALLEREGERAKEPAVLSPQAGYMLYEDGRARRFSYPAGTCAASGLALVGGNVLRLGNHAAVHKRSAAGELPPIEFLQPRNLFVRVRHKGNLVDRNEERGALKLFPFSFSQYLDSELKTGSGSSSGNSSALRTKTLKRKRQDKKDV